MIAQVTLEQVFKSTQENIGQAPTAGRVIGMVLGISAVILLLVLLQHRLKRHANPKKVNNQSKLLKEVLKTVPLKSTELKHLKELAQRQACSSPLTLLLCPSLLARGVEATKRRSDEATKG
jgi:hypothetical protein